jgi:transposase
VVLEAGNQSRWISQAMRGWGHEAIVANPRKVELISKNTRKADREDAELLARLGRMDVKLLFPIQHRTAQQQEDLEMKIRGQLVTHVRAVVKGFGQRLTSCSTEAFGRKVVEEIPPGLRASLYPLLEEIGRLTRQIRAYDREIDRLGREKYPQTAVLRQIRGVGPVTALTFVLVLSEVRRFRRSRDVGAYLGLCPRQAQSGERNPQLRITKAGHRLLRSLLVNCAQYILRQHAPDSDLKRHGEKIAERGGKNAKKRAVVAVARKLSVVMHRLWTTGEVYEPLHRGETRRAA